MALSYSVLHLPPLTPSHSIALQVGRVYWSLASGHLSAEEGRVLTNIDRDPNERKRQAALPYGGLKGRIAISNFKVGSVWLMETGAYAKIT